MRLKPIYDFLNQKLLEVSDDERRHYLYSHIHGVANCSALLALRRGINPELAIAAALLHDIAAVIHDSYDQHAQTGADIARTFLSGLGSYSVEDIDVIATAIEKHTGDPRAYQRYDAILSEADFMQPYLHDFVEPKSNSGRHKLRQLFAEFNINWSSAPE